MLSEADIGWCAGLFDGEGCIYVLRARRKARGGGERFVSSFFVRLANSATSAIEKFVAYVRSLGIEPRVVTQPPPKHGSKIMYYVTVARKRDALTLLKNLEPYLVNKAPEARMAIEYLERACAVRQYVATPDDVRLLEAITAAKHVVEPLAYFDKPN